MQWYFKKQLSSLILIYIPIFYALIFSKWGWVKLFRAPGGPKVSTKKTPLTAVEDAKQRSLAACQSTPAMKPIEPKPVKPVTSASKCSGKAERCMVVAWQLNHGQLDGIFRTFIYFG